ncbi:MAG: hypothetical protein JOZ90_04290 [Alphaproteobacteria bacterium]|nr:hypothetical protein [Alphaproteobacteria bacterium]MBV9373211.1 hypothetical protein [Alphaproteobacteria bacterium]MBV9900300.1 hypothetical protein [Alphaproteobacteria bacterium]
MRKLILAASLLAIAAPVAAQPRHDPRDDRYDARDAELRRSIPSAYEIDRIGAMLARVTDALMDVDVGPVADAIDPYGPRGRRETLGDLASRDDPYARERMHDEIRATTRGLGAATREVTIVTPIIRRSIEDSARRIDEALRDGRYRRGRYDDYRYDGR